MLSLTIPSLLFGCLVATFLGAAFHLWKDGGLGRLLLYIILAWAGFWGGHFLAESSGITFGSMGQIHFGMAIVMALIVLFVGHWLSLIRKEEQPGR